MHCPHCGSEHHLNTACTQNEERRSETQRPDEKHPLVGLDNPFWKSEKTALTA